MTREKLLKRIAQLGSITYQVRWVVNADANDYILLDELIETTIYAAKHWAMHPVLAKSLSFMEREALIRFHDRVTALFEQIPWEDPNVSIADIVENNQAMREIRGAALECLTSLGVHFTSEDLTDD
jgi:hypothetical protein